MKVPLFDISATHIDLYEKFETVFHDFIRSGNFILNEDVRQFEENFAKANGSKYALGVSSGTDALLVALLTLDIKPGDEILCPSFTFFATASTVARLGAIPIWVDVHKEDFSIDLQDAQQKISEKTKAIIPVHLFGQSCDAEALIQFSQKHQLKIIEDVAQAQGAQSHHRKTGTWGDINAFSFFPTKNLGGFGDAGMITTNDETLFERAQCIRVHGAPKRYEHVYLGGNFRIDSIQAALLNLKLPYLEDVITIRRMNAQLYQSYLKDVKNIVLPQERPDSYHTWNQFTIRVQHQQRDALKMFLEAQDIGCAVYYPKTLDQQVALRTLSSDKGKPTINAHVLASEVLSLPIYPGLKPEQIEFVCEQIHRFFKENAKGTF